MADPAVALRITAIAVLVVVGVLLAWGLRRRGRPVRPRSDAMPLLDHVEELRRRILWVLGVWVVAMVLAFSFKIRLTASGWPVPSPAIQDNAAAQLFRLVADHLVPEGVQIIVTRPMDGFLAELGLAAGMAALVALPVMLWHLFAFISPALEVRETRIMWTSLTPAVLLFFAGVAFAWILVLPLLLRTLYGYSTALGATPLLSVADLISFTVTMLLVFGLSFQTPLVMHVLARIGIISSAAFLRYWRHAIVAILIFSAFVTDPTVISQAMVAGPLLVLYFLGISAARWGERRSTPA